MITQAQIDRINALARKSKTAEGLTDEEREEQKVLRAAYVAAFKESLVSQLDSTYVLRPDGTKEKLIKK